MILLSLFWEFFKTGLFSVGGGLSTIPFLEHMGVSTGWFTTQDLTTMIAVSESTPGPMGVNMATYVGFETAGLPGAITATLGLVSPSIIIILIIAGILQKFRHSPVVEAIFAGLRPASIALIASAGLSVAHSVLVVTAPSLTQPWAAIRWPMLCLTLFLFAGMNHKRTKALHPVLWIVLGAVSGIIFQL